MADEGNDRYRAGRVDQELAQINSTLKSFERKLDKNIEWQRGVDTRLATGAQRFKTIESELLSSCGEIEELKDKDRGVLAMASTIGGAIGSATAVLIRVLGW